MWCRCRWMPWRSSAGCAICRFKNLFPIPSRFGHKGGMPLTPAFTPPPRHTDPADALAQVQRIYQQQIGHLRDAMQRFVAGETPEGAVRAFYPFVRVHTTTVARADTKLAYGFVEGPGRYETTLTRPDLFAHYYAEQFRLLRASHNVELEVGTSAHPIPIHFSFAEHDHIEGT